MRPGSLVRVLAIQLKRIGDLVLTTPALAAVRASGAHVTLALDGGTAGVLPLLVGASVDDALVYQRHGKNGASWRRLLRGGFDVCVDFTGRERSALLTLASRTHQRVIARQFLRGSGFWRRWCYNSVVETSVRSRHTADLYLDHLAALGLPAAVPDADAAPVLHLPPEAVARAREIRDAHGNDFIVVHPGSARHEKYWLPERWAEVITFCQRELGRRCVLTGGTDACERAHLARIHAALVALGGQTCADLSGRLDLPALAAVLAQASLFVGVDSGPMHLAAAWRRPQVVLFGPTNPFHWRPRHALARVLQAGHGDAPVREFADRSPGGPMDLISTRAVIDCIKGLPAHVA